MASTVVFVLTLLLAAVATMVDAQYDPELALEGLYYCKAAYCPSNGLANWTCPSCVKHHPKFTDISVFHNQTTGFLAFTGYNPTSNRIIIAFRGTNNLKNWIQDLTFHKVDYPSCAGCQVHEGFHDTWHSVKSNVLQSIAALTAAHPGAGSILVTGHSLGAAVSLLAALDLVDLYPLVPQHLYNFGEPRVGTETFAQWAVSQLQGGKQFRVTHRMDPVPHVPPMAMGFQHTPHELWYNNRGSSSWTDCQDSASQEDPLCSDSVLPVILTDHVQYLGLCTDCEKQPGWDGTCSI